MFIFIVILLFDFEKHVSDFYLEKMNRIEIKMLALRYRGGGMVATKGHLNPFGSQ